LESKKYKEKKIKKKLLQVTQAHKLLTNTFYEAKLKDEGIVFFTTTPFDFDLE